MLLIDFAYSTKKLQKSLQPDKYHKLNKTGAVALLKPMSMSVQQAL